MSIFKKNIRMILLYSLLGIFIFVNLSCFSEISSQSSSQEAPSETNKESETMTLGEVIGGTVGFFTGLFIRSDNSTETSQLKEPSQ
ncbi:MAG: hypothetical protein ACXAC6_18540 [Candidatus Hodarchaeales archaeon]|jgi:hypothetical protein